MPKPIVGFDIGYELEADGLLYVHGQKSSVQEDEHEIKFFPDWDVEELANYRLGNPNLPVHAYKQEILASVAENPLTIIVAETGAGKSTQVPQFLHDAGYKTVYLTQPRRAAARNVFSRIRDEISEIRGNFIGEDQVSFQTAGEKDGPEDAGIRVVTDGLHLVRELHNKGILENDVLIIDEAHEWNSNVEVLVAWTKKALKENPRLRVVVMSATMDAEHLAEYYSEVCQAEPSIIEVPGRTFRVEKAEKPESTVVDEVLAITTSLPSEDGNLPEGPNGILVFQPGKREILDTIEELRRRLTPEVLAKVKLFPLHAKLSPAQQQEALTQYPDCIKIVVATEVAQTSLTIPDIRFVVDSGYQRRIEVDQEGTRGLRLHAISQADCSQRAGRTGRVADGSYILTRMNATTPHVLFEDREEYPMPEILRTDIARNSLRLKALGIEIADFDMYHKAARHIIELADVNLTLLGAFDNNGEITPVGQRMDHYPLCTSSARIMVESLRFKETTRAYLAAIVASKEIGGLQYFAFNVGKRWQELTEEDSSDMLVQLDLFIAAQGMNFTEIKQYDLDINNVQRAQEQYVKVARIAGANGDPLTPPTPEEREDIKKCLYMGFLPSIYEHVGSGQYVHASNSLIDTPREISNRSLVTGNPRFVIGDPYRVELIDDGEVTIRQYIENVSIANVTDLGAVAASQTVWHPEDYVVREGKFYQRQRQRLLGIDLGVLQEVTAEPSPRLRAEIIEHTLKNEPGREQKKLRHIKSELEWLARHAKDSVPILTHDQITNLVYEAAPENITTPATIEDNLRIILSDPERRLSLDDFVSPERREEIVRNAPARVEVEGRMFPLNYSRGVPTVRITNLQDVTLIEANELALPDGREISFVYKRSDGHSKKYNLAELKYRIENGLIE